MRSLFDRYIMSLRGAATSRDAHRVWVASALLATVAACSKPAESPPAAPAAGSAEPARVEAVDPVPEPETAHIEPLEPEPELPPEIPVPGATASFPIGPSGGSLVAGGLSLDVPSGALSEETLIELELLEAPEELGRELPGSLALGTYRGAPWNPQLSRAARLSVPLTRQLEPGTQVELLAWQPQMRAFIVAGYARVDETGARATFPVRQLGDLLVRAAPVQREGAAEACPGDNFGLHDAWPIASEDDAVGLTAVEERYPRGLAFSLLTDFRLAPAFGRIDFKNEEVVNGPAFRADERNHQDEDFLMDPNAAAALTALAALVDHEWVDPLTGESAVRVRVTEAYDSLIEHSPRSTHYQGRAIDLTLSPVPAADGASRREWYGRLSSLARCAGFDWVLFENTAHVHASVVGTEIGFVTEDGAALVAATSSLRRPRELRTTRHRWAEASDGVVDFRWRDEGDFELVTHAVHEDDLAHTTADGLREVVVHDGRAYLVNTGPIPPLGSVDADGSPVDVEYPLPVSPPDVRVLDATFRAHGRTREALERHVLTSER